jgi:hypothetical protein
LTAASRAPWSDLGAGFIDDWDFGPGPAAAQSRRQNFARRAAGELPGNRWTAVPDSDDEPFGILVFSGVRLAGRIGVQEESSAPHARLACIHLQTSFY